MKIKQICFASNWTIFLLKLEKNLSNQAIVRSKINLTSVYRRYDDEISTLDLEHYLV